MPAVQCDQDDVSNIERKIQGDQLLEGDQLQMSREGGAQVQCDQDAPRVQCDQDDNLNNIVGKIHGVQLIEGGEADETLTLRDKLEVIGYFVTLDEGQRQDEEPRIVSCDIVGGGEVKNCEIRYSHCAERRIRSQKRNMDRVSARVQAI